MNLVNELNNLIKHLEKMLEINEDQLSTDWDYGWGAGCHYALKCIRELNVKEE